MKLTLIHIACLIAIFQAVLVAIYFLTIKRNNKLSINILAAWIFIFAIVLCCSFLVSNDIWQYFVDYHKTIFIISQLSFLLGPLFYLYIDSLFSQKFKIKAKYIFHLSPLVIIVSYIIFTFISIPRFVIWGTFLDFFSNGVFLIQNLIYLILTLRILQHYGFSVNKFFSPKGSIQFIWVRFLVLGNLVIWIAKCQSFLFWFFSRDGSWCTFTATTYFMTFFIFFNTILFFVLKTPDFFSKNKKYENSILSDALRIEYKDKLVRHMETEKPFLNMDLNLDILSKELSIQTRYLSEVINVFFQKNFFDFINDYRIEECKRLFNDSKYDNRNILEIAFESGFNTKATFNSAFKKRTSVTPLQYRKNNSRNKKIK